MIRPRFLLMSASAAAVLAAALGIGASGVRADGADYVRWDIINITVPFSPTPPITTISSGGVAFALADANLKIQFTGSGTFIAPTSRGESSAVTGGGTWETFDKAGTSTGKGTYRVRELVRFDLAPGTAPLPNDNIGPLANERAGLLVLRISYSDGSGGVLVVSCHLVGTPTTVIEGVTISKGFVGFLGELPPAPPGNANRTSFHLLGDNEH